MQAIVSDACVITPVVSIVLKSMFENIPSANELCCELQMLYLISFSFVLCSIFVQIIYKILTHVVLLMKNYCFLKELFYVADSSNL